MKTYQRPFSKHIFSRENHEIQMIREFVKWKKFGIFKFFLKIGYALY